MMDEPPEAAHAFDDDQASDPRSVHRPDLEALMRGCYAAALKRALLDTYSPRVSSRAAAGAG